MKEVENNSMFSKDPVNTGRQPALDYGKGLAIIGMIICHTVLYWCTGFDNLAYEIAIKWFGGPLAAPLFMICLGVGVVYSRHSEPLQLVARGVKLLLVAYALNIVRLALPLWILSFIVGADAVAPYMTWAVMIVDILQFAGLAFIFLGIAKKLKMSNLSLIAFAVICSFIGCLCVGYDTGNEAINAIVGLFIPAGTGLVTEGTGMEVSCFPFCNWIIFPVFGILLGKTLQRCNNLQRFYSIVLPISFIAVAFYYYMSRVNGFMPFSSGGYYWLSIIDAIFFIIIDLFIISAMYFIGKVVPERALRPLALLSRNINSVYCISWVLIFWMAIPVMIKTDMKGISAGLAYIPGVIIIFLSYYMSVWYNNKKEKLRSK